MRLPVVLAAIAAAGLLLSGPTLLAGPAGQAAAQTSTYSPPTGAGVMGYMNSYVMTHPYRLGTVGTTLPTMTDARDDLVSTLQGFGLYVQRHSYSLGGQSGQNIIAYQNGTTKPNEWIVLSAHYDSTETTIYGAWDDGAGVAQLLELARSYSTRTFNRTIIYAFFDDEEQGLQGSKAFVAAYKNKIVDNLNFDPPGLNWPCTDVNGNFLPVKVSFNPSPSANVAGYNRIKNAVIAGLDHAGVPTSARDMANDLPIAMVFGSGLVGTSDHASFDDEDIPNAFVGSLPSVRQGNVVRAISYPLHTPADDLNTMIARCGGGLPVLTQAFEAQVKIVTKAVEILDGP